MTDQPYWTLVGLELRRFRQGLVRIGVFLLAVVVFSLMVESPTSVLSFGLAAVGGALGMQIPFDALQDRMTGNLEVLTTLPVTPLTLAGARLTALVLIAALGAVPMAAAGGVVGPAFLGDLGLIRIIIAAFLGAWTMLSVMSAVLLALVLRFKIKLLVPYGAMVALGAVMAGGYLVDRLFGGPLRLIQAIMASDHTLAIAIGGALVGAALVLTGSFLITRKGFGIYEPEPDAMDW